VGHAADLWCTNTLAGFSVNPKTVLWEISVIVARRKKFVLKNSVTAIYAL